MSSAPLFNLDFKLHSKPHLQTQSQLLSPLSDECEINNNSDDEFSELSSLSPSTPNSPILNLTNTTNTSNAAANNSNTASNTHSTTATVKSTASLLPLIERPRRMTKREQLDRLDVLELEKKTRKLTAEEKKEFQRLRRRKQNRDAAATSRDRKRDYTSSLEATIKQMQEKQAEMQRTIENLLKERQTLLKQVEQLDAQQIQTSQPMNVSTTDAKDGECGKRGKKRALSECVNESTALCVSSSSLNSCLSVISSAEPALLSLCGGNMSNTLVAVTA